MEVESPSHIDAVDFDDNDVARVAMLARKATRKASLAANKDGYFVEHANGACIVKSRGKTETIELKTSPIDVRKRYTFSSGTR